MAEELFQDGVKQVASAYGALINNANEAGKEDTLQYLMVILKMLQSVTLPLE
jgi:ferritin-like metal-binding protein YciE